MKKIITTISLTVLLVLSPAFSAQHIDFEKLDIIDNALCISYKVNELLDDKSIEALQRGIKSEIVHSIQLWRDSNIINSCEKETPPYSIKVYWDNWEKKYRIESADENRLTSNIETVKQKCTVMENFSIVNLDELDKNETYYVTVQVEFQLISAESYNAISDIFSGKKKKSESTKKSGFVSVLVNLLGLGDKEFAYKSNDFTITPAGIHYVE